MLELEFDSDSFYLAAGISMTEVIREYRYGSGYVQFDKNGEYRDTESDWLETEDSDWLETEDTSATCPECGDEIPLHGRVTGVLDVHVTDENRALLTEQLRLSTSAGILWKAWDEGWDAGRLLEALSEEGEWLTDLGLDALEEWSMGLIPGEEDDDWTDGDDRDEAEEQLSDADDPFTVSLSRDEFIARALEC